MNYKERLNILYERSTDLTADDIKFIDNINQYAAKKIDYNKPMNRDWLSDKILTFKNHSLWKNLSKSNPATKHFNIDKNIDNTEGIFYIDIDYLIKMRGNPTGGLGKEIELRKLFDKGVKLDVPQFWLGDNNLGEGNHRVLVAKEYGYKSVPVHVYWR